MSQPPEAKTRTVGKYKIEYHERNEKLVIQNKRNRQQIELGANKVSQRPATLFNQADEQKLDELFKMLS
jgi:hypothetical protein